jgi:hypothetical protein
MGENWGKWGQMPFQYFFYLRIVFLTMKLKNKAKAKGKGKDKDKGKAKDKDKGKGKGKAVPLQTRCVPEGSRKLRFPDFMTTAQDDGKVVNLTHRSPLPPGNTPGTHAVRG